MSDARMHEPGRHVPTLLVFGVLVQLLLVLVSPYVAFVSGIRSDSCSEDCDYGVIGFGSALAIGAPLVCVVLVVVLAAILRRRRGLVWLPAGGIALTFALWALAYEVTGAGLPGGALAP